MPINSWNIHWKKKKRKERSWKHYNFDFWELTKTLHHLQRSNSWISSLIQRAFSTQRILKKQPVYWVTGYNTKVFGVLNLFPTTMPEIHCVLITTPGIRYVTVFSYPRAKLYETQFISPSTFSVMLIIISGIWYTTNQEQSPIKHNLC